MNQEVTRTYASKKEHAIALAEEFPEATRQELIQMFMKHIPNMTSGAASTYASDVRKLAQANLNHKAVVAKRDEARAAETDEQIAERLTERFDVIENLAVASCQGKVRSLIVSGPAGLGKTFTVEKARDMYDPEENKSIMIKGMVRPTGLYLLLHEYRHPGNVVILDDADSIFNDVDALNILKVALDTTSKRVISWRAETKMMDADGNPVDRDFEFQGTVIFISNMDFDREIERGSKMAEHYEALQSRSFFIDCDMKTERDYIVRIRQVVEQGMLKTKGVDLRGQSVIMSFLESNAEKFRELTLRVALKLADAYNVAEGEQKRFESLSRISLFKPQYHHER